MLEAENLGFIAVVVRLEQNGHSLGVGVREQYGIDNDQFHEVALGVEYIGVVVVEVKLQVVEGGAFEQDVGLGAHIKNDDEEAVLVGFRGR